MYRIPYTVQRSTYVSDDDKSQFKNTADTGLVECSNISDVCISHKTEQ